MNLRLVTLTGADDGSDPAELVKLSKKFPFVEWGILVSAKQMGSTRFPSSSWMKDLAAAVTGSNVSLAVHVCGRWVRDIVAGRFPTDLADLPMPWNNVRRFQLNFHAEKHDFSNDIVKVLEEQPFFARQIIFQYDGVNEAAIEESPRKYSNAPLFDVSHGAGILPSNWPKASSFPGHAFYGYAGGLGPDCLPAQLDVISAASEGKPFWIDMETKLRTQDTPESVFDFQRCEACLDACAPFVNKITGIFY